MTDPTPSQPSLVRVLGAWDVATITIGTVMGSAIFIAAALVPAALPHPTLVLLAWLVGGLITLAGALSFAELAAMYPAPGGQYQYLKHAFGALPAFLFGWISLLAIQTGGVAFPAVGFAEYLSVFFPWFGTGHVVLSIPLGSTALTVSGGQLAAVGAIVLLSAVNYLGAKEGAWTQGVVTAVKVVSLLGLVVVGLALPARAAPNWTAPVPTAGLATGLMLALLAVFGNFDGWYQATMSAGEVKDPGRNLPRGMVGGTLVMIALYLLANWVYLRVLPVDVMGRAARVGEQAATALLGGAGGRVMAALVLVSTFGCVSSSLVGAARLGLAMAEDGIFFRPFARIHPRFRTPTTSIVFVAIWSSLMVFSASYDQIFTYSVFSALVFHILTGAAVGRLRRLYPDAARPYRVPGYPWVPAIFVLANVAVGLNAIVDRPRETLVGLLVLFAGVPAYYWLRRPIPARA
jgi:APA family basic amino acid/polyamine antiporter